jgi:hypothetical protein
MRVISTDDGWIIVYRDDKLVYEGHGGTYWAQAMALTGVNVYQAELAGDNSDYQIDNLCSRPDADLEAFENACAAAGYHLRWNVL